LPSPPPDFNLEVEDNTNKPERVYNNLFLKAILSFSKKASVELGAAAATTIASTPTEAKGREHSNVFSSTR
jgi:hypothetical protein